METVGFIGLGKMGTAMATNIQKARYPMVVYDIRAEAATSLLNGGARLAGSPAEVARSCDVTFTSLPEPREIEEVAVGPQGILEGIKEGGIYLDISTAGPVLMRRLEPFFRQKGAHVLDAPVMSSPPIATERHMIVMVGGEREVFHRVHPILSTFSDQVMYTGALGSGCIIKLVTNTMGMVAAHAIVEGLTLGLRAGARIEDLLEAGSRSEVGGILGIMKQPFAKRWFRGDHEPGFRLALARKDVGETTELGREFNVSLPVISVLEQTLMEGLSRGWADKDFIITFLLQQERAGVEVRLPDMDK